MNQERIVSDWLRASAPPRASDVLLKATLDRVAAVPQERVLWRRDTLPRPRGRSRPMLALAATLVALGLIGALAVFGGPPPNPVPTTAPTPTPTRLGLAYSLDGDIYVANSDGANPVRIADGEPDAGCNAYRSERGFVSPDGRYVAYRSGYPADCPGAVFVTDLVRQSVTSLPGVGWDIAWSPDATHIATWLEAGSTIGIYRVDGVLEAVLDGSSMCCGDYDPVWSPNGAASVLIKERGFGGVIFGVVWELPIDGGAPVRVPADDPRSSLGRGWFDPMLTYSPDRTLAVVSTDSSLSIVAADGSSREVIVASVPGRMLEGHSVWSPTGESIAYVETRALTFDGDGSPGERLSVLRLVDPRTGTVIDTTATVSGRVRIEPIGFSPDGQQLLYGEEFEDEGGAAALWVVNADGSGARRLVEGTSTGGWVLLPAEIVAPAMPSPRGTATGS